MTGKEVAKNICRLVFKESPEEISIEEKYQTGKRIFFFIREAFREKVLQRLI